MFEAPQVWGVHARGLAPFHRRSVAEFDLSPASVLLISPFSKTNKNFTHLEYVVCINNSRPIQINHLESQPWYLFYKTIVMPQCCNWTIHLISQGHEQRDGLFNAIRRIMGEISSLIISDRVCGPYRAS